MILVLDNRNRNDRCYVVTHFQEGARELMQDEARNQIAPWILLVVWLCACAPLLGQAQRAIVLGKVTDASGALVPGADVKVIEIATSVVRSTVTNSEGNYEVPGLMPGRYRVEASLRGFRTALVDNIPVAGAQRAEIAITLVVGEISDSITVTSDEQILDTANADVNLVLGEKEIQDLPVGQGHVTYLFRMSPAASQAGGLDIQPLQRAQTSRARFNGSPDGTGEFTIDGTPNMQRINAVLGGGAANTPTVDMVKEVRVQANTFDASMGHSGGTSIDLTIKSGTNDFHGSASAFFRRPQWNANSWDGNRTGTERPDFRYRRWGYTVGGPIVKNKTFFFWGFEKWEDLASGIPVSATVPRPQHLRGDFSDLLALGSQYQLYDPLTARVAPNGRIQRDPFPNNIIPENRIHPVARKLNAFWPAPNASGTPDGFTNFSYLLFPLPRKAWNYALRLDHDLSPSHKLFGRWLYSSNDSNQWNLWGRTDVSVWFQREKVPNIAVGDVWTIGPSFVVDFRASVMRHSIETVPHKGGLSWADLGVGAEKLIDSDRLGFPTVSIAGYSILGEVDRRFQGFRNFPPYLAVQDVRSASAHFTKLFRNHSVKFGTEYRGHFMNVIGSESLIATFNPTFTTGPFDNSPAPTQGGGLADFLLGLAQGRIVRDSNPTNFSPFYAFYIHDDWKVTPKLTLNVGLRWEREGPQTERHDRAVTGFAFATENPIAAKVRANYAKNPIPEIPPEQFRVNGGALFAGVSGPRTAWDADNNNLAPRLGLAYQLTENLVIRAGYGIFYVPNALRFWADPFGAAPGFTAVTDSFATLDGGLTFTGGWDRFFPQGVLEPQGASQGLKTFLGQGFNIPGALRDFPNAYNQRWQFEIQRKLSATTKLEVRYVGNRTLKMPIPRDLNALPNQYLSTSPERDQATINHLSQLVPNPFRGVPGVGGSLGVASVVSRSTLLKPFPAFGSITVQDLQGWSTYHALQVELDHKQWQGLRLSTNYTWAKIIDAMQYLNAGDPVPTKTLAVLDRPHVWRLIAMYHLPFGKGQRLGAKVAGLLGTLINGWQIQAFSYVQAGTPLTWENVLFRGNVKDIPMDNPRPEHWFSVEGFERNPQRQLGSNLRTFPLRLGGVRDDTAADTAFSLFKNTAIGERATFQLRFEAYNLFNQHYFTGGNGATVNTSPTSSLFGTTTTASGGRALQLGIKLLF